VTDKRMTEGQVIAELRSGMTLGIGGWASRRLVAALAYGAAGMAMGTRFLLTSDSPVPDNVKAEYLKRTVNDTVVTSVIDGVPQRILRTELAERLIKSNRVALLPRSIKSAAGFKKLSGASWADIGREGLAMKKSHQLSWAQVIMAANTPMMLKASMVNGRTDLGTLASGQISGADRRLAQLCRAHHADHDRSRRVAGTPHGAPASQPARPGSMTRRGPGQACKEAQPTITSRRQGR
jgi:hypothetical protein